MAEATIEDAIGKAASMLVFGAFAFGGNLMGVASFLLGQAPIWRVPGRPGEGAGFGDYVYRMMCEVEHLPIEEAKREAYHIYREEEWQD